MSQTGLVELRDEAEYFDLRLTVSGNPADAGMLDAEVWGGMAIIASSRHIGIAWAKTDVLTDALSDKLGIFLTLVPGTIREVAEDVASELRTKPHVLRVDVIPCTWAITPGLSWGVALDRAHLFRKLLLAFYLYDPEGIGVANSDFVNNADEYAAEAKDVILHLPKARSISDVERLLGEVWERYFGTSRNIEALAREVWGIWQAEISAN